MNPASIPTVNIWLNIILSINFVKAKNAEFDATFESVEKVAKKFPGRKLEG
jgi:hypothetical protein